MKDILLIIFTFCLNILQAQELKLNTDKSIINWTGKAALTSYSMSGTLRLKSGILILNDSSIKSSYLVVDMKSLDAENNDLEKHLRCKDFFEVKRYDEATFSLNRIELTNSDSALVSGQAMIRGIKDSLVFTISIQKNAEFMQLSGSLFIDRTKFGVYYNSTSFFENLKEQAIDNFFKLDFKLFFERIE